MQKQQTQLLSMVQSTRFGVRGFKTQENQ